MICSSLCVGLINAVTGHQANLILALFLGACAAFVVVFIGWQVETCWRRKYEPGLPRNIQVMQVVVNSPGLNAVVAELTKNPEELKTTTEIASAVGRDTDSVFEDLMYLNELDLAYCGSSSSQGRHWRIQSTRWSQLMNEYQSWSDSQPRDKSEAAMESKGSQW